MSALPELPNPLTAGRVVGSDIDAEEYRHQVVERGHPDYTMGRTDLLDVLHCPHKWLMGYESKETDATEWGELFEQKIMYPEVFELRYAVVPEVYPATAMECPKCKSRTDATTCRKCKCDRVKVTFEKPWDFNATYCSEWKEAQGKKVIIKHETEIQADNATKFFWAKPQLAELVRCSKRQVMVEAKYADKETGIVVPVRGLIDFVPDKTSEEFGQCLADLKTTRNAEPFNWARDVFQYGLHVQGALYLDLYNCACKTESRIDFRHLISESGPPWEPAARILSQDFITLGRMRYIDALKRYAQCLNSGIWPGYDTAEAGTFYQGWLITEPEAWMINRT